MSVLDIIIIIIKTTLYLDDGSETDICQLFEADIYQLFEADIYRLSEPDIYQLFEESCF